MYYDILYEIKGAIAVITINRATHGNAFSTNTYGEIIDAMHRVSSDDTVKVAILTGSGKNFCAGGDIDVFQQLIIQEKAIEKADVIMTGALVESVKYNKKPVIAAVNGVSAGAGMGLALACDFILIGYSTRFLTAFIDMALPGDTVLMQTLQASIGTFRMTQHMMLNQPIDAPLAKEYGLVYDVVADDAIMTSALMLAEKLAKKSGQALAYQKALAVSMFYPQFTEFNQKEAEFMHLSSKGQDHYDAVESFVNKKAKHH